MKPILFNGEMVRAILAGRKTQTRRIVRDQTIGDRWCEARPDGMQYLEWQGEPTCGSGIWEIPEHNCEIIAPLGKVGDRLYVRETWSQPAAMDPGPTVYRADYPACVPPEFENVPPADAITWKPSIHMPRSASRITLEITGVRVERLQDISEADAQEEGYDGSYSNLVPFTEARRWFLDLWDRINGSGAQNCNPWVWVYEFKRVES